jgi:hypothetical protein
MAKFYHIDRHRRLRLGDVICLQRPTFTSDKSNVAALLSLFPDGLSQHGLRYLGPDCSESNASIELELERVRRLICPEAPWRFESIFAFDNIDDARQHAVAGIGLGGMTSFQLNLFTPASPGIWLIEGDHSFRADMKALDRGTLSERAYEYWSGTQNSKGIPPQWEIIVPLPVQILSKA